MVDGGDARNIDVQTPDSTSEKGHGVVDCVIIAAGQGTRVADLCDCKPLLPLCGIPLIERTIRSAAAAGGSRFVVVTGFRRERVELFLTELARRERLDIQCVFNPEWRLANGVSVLAAQGRVTEPFVLMMCDHLFEVPLLHGLSRADLGPGEVGLAVDSDLANPSVDLDDVMKVDVRDGRVRRIGKELGDYNGFDTGLFLCTTALFQALEQSCADGTDTSLAGGVRSLASEGRVRAVDVSGRFWLDVDDARAVGLAEERLGPGPAGPAAPAPAPPLILA